MKAQETLMEKNKRMIREGIAQMKRIQEQSKQTA